MKKKEESKIQMMELSILDERGFEIPDPVPMAVPVDFERPKTMAELVRDLVKYEVSRTAAAEGEESFEEADDFEVGDDPEIRSPYELDDEQETASNKELFNEEPKAKADSQPDLKIKLKPATMPAEGMEEPEASEAQ